MGARCHPWAVMRGARLVSVRRVREHLGRRMNGNVRLVVDTATLIDTAGRSIPGT